MGLKQIRTNCCGIDIGASAIFVAFDDDTVVEFGTFTDDFEEAIAQLRRRNVHSVAMESTGVYGVILFEMLQKAGFEVFLVNPARLKYVPGRKTDVLDCQWLQQLHSYGLLSASFVPDEQIKPIRTLLRMREMYIEESSRAVQRMQKALICMNIRLSEVISQIHGTSGMRIIQAILQGERDPQKLVALCEERIRRTKSEQVIKSLKGAYTKEHLFALSEAVSCREFYQGRIAVCDAQIDEELSRIGSDNDTPQNPGAAKKRIRHNVPEIPNLHSKILKATNGKSVEELPGLTDYSALRLIGEIGIGVDAFPTEGHFTSWLKLVPGKKQSGKMNNSYRFKKSPPASLIFRQAAVTIIESKNIALGAFGKRLKAKKGPGIATKAVARKLAEMYYRTMKFGFEYVEKGVQAYQAQFEQRKIKYLTKQAAHFGFQLSPALKTDVS